MERLLFVSHGSHDDLLLAGELRPSFDLLTSTIGADALSKCRSWHPHGVLIVIESQVQEAASLTRALRADSNINDCGVVVLTDRSDIFSEQILFSAGADQVLTQPISIESLQLKVTALVQRVSGRMHSQSSEQYLGSLLLDLKSNLVISEGAEPVALSPLHMRLLSFFARHQDHTLTREQIQSAIWPGQTVSARTVDAHISKLKKSLPALNELIQKAYGKGYRIQSRRKSSSA